MKYENEIMVRSFQHAVESLKREYEKWDVKMAREEHNSSLLRVYLRQTQLLVDEARAGGIATEVDVKLANHFAKAEDRLHHLDDNIQKVRDILVNYAYGIEEIEKIITDSVYAISLYDQETIDKDECIGVIEASTTKIQELLGEIKGSEEE